MIVVLDTSALAKLLLAEPESSALRESFHRPEYVGTEWAVSTLAVTELRRLTIRLDLDPALIEPVVKPFRVVLLTQSMLELAGRLRHPHLGTLDAIHIATALSIAAAALTTYDERQADAASREGLRTLTPSAQG